MPGLVPQSAVLFVASGEDSTGCVQQKHGPSGWAMLRSLEEVQNLSCRLRWCMLDFGISRRVDGFHLEGRPLGLVDAEELGGGTELVLQVTVVHARLLDFTMG